MVEVIDSVTGVITKSETNLLVRGVHALCAQDTDFGYFNTPLHNALYFH